MPDDRPQSQAMQIASLVLNCIQTIVIAWITIQSNQTHEKVEKVEKVQQESADTTKEVKVALDERTKTADKDAAEQRKATASMLYGNWKYLEGVAVTVDELKEAANAKKRYEEFTTKKN